MSIFGAIAGVAGALIGGKSQSDAAEDAAAVQAESARQATDEIARQYDISRADQQNMLAQYVDPLYRSGKYTQGAVNYLLGLGVEPGERDEVNALYARYRRAGDLLQRVDPTSQPWQQARSEAANALRGMGLDPEKRPSRYEVPLDVIEGRDFGELARALPTGEQQQALADREFTRADLPAEPGAPPAFDYQPYQAPAPYQGRAAPQFSPVSVRPFEFDAEKLYDDPGYQVRLREGEKTLERAAAARGNRLSGAQAKALERFSQDYAANEYGAAYGRAEREFERELAQRRENQAQRYAADYQSWAGNEAQRYQQHSDAYVRDYARYLDDLRTRYGLQSDAYQRGIGQFESQYARDLGMLEGAYGREAARGGDVTNQLLAERAQLYGMLQPGTQAGMGAAAQAQGTAANVAGQGSVASRSIADYLTQGGNAQAAGIMGSANAMSGAWQNVGNYLTMWDLLRDRGQQQPAPVSPYTSSLAAPTPPGYNRYPVASSGGIY